MTINRIFFSPFWTEEDSDPNQRVGLFVKKIKIIITTFSTLVSIFPRVCCVVSENQRLGRAKEEHRVLGRI
jgi:hypothetical protein